MKHDENQGYSKGERPRNAGRLVFVPTPIGNLDDITVRGLRLLEQADHLFCEDSRRTGRLIELLGLPKRTLRVLYAHNEARVIDEIITDVSDGAVVAIVSDAGSPGLSDPGGRLLAAAVAHGIEPEVLPGANALIPALVASGLTTRHFFFEGFLPQKKGRRTRIALLSERPETSVIFESPYRLVRLLGELVDVCGPGRPAAVARELTKLHEEVARGSLAELHERFSSRSSVKGECVVILGPADSAS